MTRSIKVAILSSDSRLMGQALQSRLVGESQFSVLAAAGTIHELLVRAAGRAVDVLLVYAGMRSPRVAAEIISDLKLLMPASRLIVLGCATHDRNALAWIEAGAAAWLDENASYAALIEAIRDVSQGRVMCPPETIPGIIDRLVSLGRQGGGEAEALTDREIEVANWLSLGASNKELSRRFGIRASTAKSYAFQVLKKLNATGRGDLDLKRTRNRAE